MKTKKNGLRGDARPSCSLDRQRSLAIPGFPLWAPRFVGWGGWGVGRSQFYILPILPSSGTVLAYKLIIWILAKFSGAEPNNQAEECPRMDDNTDEIMYMGSRF